MLLLANSSFSILVLVILLSFPQHTIAARCFDPSPSVLQKKDVFMPVQSRRLSRDEQLMVQALVSGLQGNWQGSSKGTICLGNVRHPKVRTVQENILAEVQYHSPGTLQLQAELYRPKDRVSHQERLRLILDGDVLRIDENTAEGELEILAIKPGKITVLVKNRQQGARVSKTRRANVVREFVRSLSIQGRTLLIEQAVYTNGELSGWSDWRLHKVIR